MNSRIQKLIMLHKKKKAIEKQYSDALNVYAAELSKLPDISYPFRIGTNGYEFIKNKDGKIFFRKYNK